MAIRMIICDLDGTLIDSSLAISDRTVEAFRKARARGVITAIATGRPYDAMAFLAQRLGITDPVITCQGSEILDVVTGRPLWQCPMPHEDAKEFLKIAEERHIYAQYYRTDGFYMEKDCAESQAYERLAGGKQGKAVGSPLWQKIPADALKEVMITDPKRVEEMYPEIRDRFAGRLEITVSLPYMLEAMHPDVCKGNALKAYAKLMNIDMADIMAFGDARNDISMLSAVGHGVAVGNAHPDAKAAARYITGCQWEDGVAMAIEKYILGEDADGQG